MTEKELQQLIKYLETNGIKYNIQHPETFTASVKDSKKKLVVDIQSEQELKEFIEKVNQENLNKEPKIRTTVIGGGRGDNNNSYSIGDIWEGVDVFIRLISKPKVEENEKASAKNGTTVVSISPNIMLFELNDALSGMNYHCPTLCGCLPFMSFAGGLSTGSHTSFGYLADVVVGIRVLLPDGKEKYIAKGDSDFDLFTKNPSLGLLGTILSIDIEAKPSRMKLHRSFDYKTYGDLADLPAADPLRPNEAQAIIFSPVDLNEKTPIKITKWKWVRPETPSTKQPIEPAVADGSYFATTFLPWLVKQSPRFFSKVFNKFLKQGPNNPVVAEPGAIMGPEKRLTGYITEMGVMFDYSKGNLKCFTSALQNLLKREEYKNAYPVNTAIFLRFPKKLGAKEGYQVVVDFASLGLDLKILPTFVDQLREEMKNDKLNPVSTHLHFGKSRGIIDNTNAWDQSKNRFKEFYKRNNLDGSLLEKSIMDLEIGNNTPVTPPSAVEAQANPNTANEKLKEEATIEESLKKVCTDYVAMYETYLEALCKKLLPKKLSDEEKASVFEAIVSESQADFDRIKMEYHKLNKNKEFKSAHAQYKAIVELKNYAYLPTANREKFKKLFEEQKEVLLKPRTRGESFLRTILDCFDLFKLVKADVYNKAVFFTTTVGRNFVNKVNDTIDSPKRVRGPT